MTEIIIIPLLGLYICYAWIASDTFRDFIRAKKKLKYFKRWVG